MPSGIGEEDAAAGSIHAWRLEPNPGHIGPRLGLDNHIICKRQLGTLVGFLSNSHYRFKHKIRYTVYSHIPFSLFSLPIAYLICKILQSPPSWFACDEGILMIESGKPESRTFGGDIPVLNHHLAWPRFFSGYNLRRFLHHFLPPQSSSSESPSTALSFAGGTSA